MLPRVIPCLLLKDEGLWKTKKFQNPVYLGDPINVIRLFNDKGADELILLDILATPEQRSPNYDYLKQLADECFMPLAYGGGITNIEQIKKLLRIGIEKVIINSAAFFTRELITDASRYAGSQAIVVSIDVRKSRFGKYQIYTNCGTKKIQQDLLESARKFAELGAGEIMINSIDRDGMMAGYDLDLVSSVSQSVDIPVIACGGAGSLDDFAKAVKNGASAVAAGSLFVFHGKLRGVLINYPTRDELENVFIEVTDE